MSIFNGHCDHGSQTENPCVEPAVYFSRSSTYTFCAYHNTSFGTRAVDGWPEIVKAFEARQREIVETIERAEREGYFLWYDDHAYSPRVMRSIFENNQRDGWTTGLITVVENPQHLAELYEREAHELNEQAEVKRAEARRIRHELKKQAAIA